MLEAGPELAPDLEWMLQSKQISDRVVLEELATNYAGNFWKLALAVLGDFKFAQQAVDEALLLISRERYNYWGTEPLGTWLLEHVVRVCRQRYFSTRWQLAWRSMFSLIPRQHRFLESEATGPVPNTGWEAELWLYMERIGLQARSILYLHWMAGLPADQIAVVLHSSQRRVSSRLKRLNASLSGKLPEKTAGSLSPDEILLTSLERFWSLPETQSSGGKDYLPPSPGRIQSEVRDYLLQSLLAGGVLVLVALISWITNRVMSPQSPNPLVAQTVIVTRIVEVPVFVTATPAPPPTPALLTGASSSNMIRTRMEEGAKMWQSLWAQGLILEYGPPGYTGLPQIRRDEVWISQPYNSLVLSGPINSEVDRIWFANNGKVYLLDLDSLRPILYDFHSQSLPVYSLLRDLLFPHDGLTDDVRLVAVETGMIAQRPTLRVDELAPEGFRSRSLWLDQATGIILMERTYAPDGESVVREVIITTIALDPEMPEHIFNRNALPVEFTYDWQGQQQPDGYWLAGLPPEEQIAGHIPSQRIFAHPDFDPALSRLRFEWNEPLNYFENPSRISRETVSNTFTSRAQPLAIFADGFFLGSSRVGNVWDLVCERSPDGGYLAFVERTDSTPSENTRLRWLALDDVEQVREVFEPQAVIGEDIAFSPDSKSLAYWGCDAGSSSCGVFLLDLKTNNSKRLYSTGYVNGFVWDADGEELAMLTANEYLVIVNVPTGRVTYRGPVNWQTYPLQKDGSGEVPQAEFPLAHSGLAACEASPPSNSLIN